MKSRIKKGARIAFQEVRDKTERQSQEPMKDPTLEGIEENKVGRIPEKSDHLLITRLRRTKRKVLDHSDSCGSRR
jgi:hypothetical protein